jgi:hypothetical protein
MFKRTDSQGVDGERGRRRGALGRVRVEVEAVRCGRSEALHGVLVHALDHNRLRDAVLWVASQR